MKDFIKRLSSRKFLVTIAGIVGVTLYPERANDIIMLIGVYVGAEGAGDVVGRYQDGQVKRATIDQTTAGINAGVIETLPAVDKSTVVPGSAGANSIGSLE